MAAKEYNGHHCWTCWNVALWLGGDYGLYQLAKYHWQAAKGKAGIAARRMLEDLPKATPDGARYSFQAVRTALLGLFGDE